MRFSEYIKQLRETKGLTQKDAAKELGITPQRLCDYESGRRTFAKQPSLAFLRSLATVYDHPFASLVCNTEYFQYEQTIIADLLKELSGIAEGLDAKTLEMLVEARAYTPEMEGLAGEAQALAQSLKMALLLAKTKYQRAPKGHLLET